STSLKEFTVNGVSDDATVEENNTDVNFHCRGIGHPAPNVSISLGSRRLAENTSHLDDITTVLDFRIPTVSPSDMGSYTCTADNGFSVHESVQLNVQ
ncbi:hypothetical protein BaRGS_00033699, partial [Batillaria attramentaria]